MDNRVKGKIVAWVIIGSALGGIWGLDQLTSPPEVAPKEPSVQDFMPTREDCYNHPDELSGYGC